MLGRLRGREAGHVAVQLVRLDEVGHLGTGLAVRADHRGVRRENNRPRPGGLRPPQHLHGQRPVPGHIHLHPPRRSTRRQVRERNRRIRGHRQQRPGAGDTARGRSLARRIRPALQRARGNEDGRANRRAQHRGRSIAGRHIAQHMRPQPQTVPGFTRFRRAHARTSAPAEVAVDVSRQGPRRVFLQTIHPANELCHRRPSPRNRSLPRLTCVPVVPSAQKIGEILITN